MGSAAPAFWTPPWFSSCVAARWAFCWTAAFSKRGWLGHHHLPSPTPPQPTTQIILQHSALSSWEDCRSWPSSLCLPLRFYLRATGGASGKEPACQWGEQFDPWMEKIRLLEEGMATHSSILACRIPRTEEPGRLWLKQLSIAERNRKEDEH